MDTIALEVRMWTPLRGRLHDFTTVVCDAPDPAPRDTDEWHRWAVAHLEEVAPRDGWQPGRYHYRAEIRDEAERVETVLSQDHWQYDGTMAP
ncbi:hypothetical protein GCM10009836_70000 [Pseudonocardia ailaonensis]|uniref:Uncharacterized protein n=1 Tax=Pseudonocardia ailaonensis TaxID=367279 RepID=A0ABN2NNV1_9PSEU